MDEKKQYNNISQNELEKDNIGSNIGKFNMDKNETEEDVTKYGEFISSYFVWTTLSKQKQRAEELNDMTKRKK